MNKFSYLLFQVRKELSHSPPIIIKSNCSKFFPDSSCTSEFLTPTELRQKTLNLNINDMQRKQRQQIIFPNMTFTCNGSITKLIAVVDVLEEKGVPLMAPEVQIWRKSRNESKDSYAKIKFIFITTTQVFNRNVVELNLQDPIKVQKGDILGVYQPRYNESTLSIRYQIRDGPINYVIEQQDNALSSLSQVESSIPSYDYPLVSMEIRSGANDYTLIVIVIN